MSKIYKNDCPCRDCGRRKVNCHSICKDYRRWKLSGIEKEKIQKFNFINFSLVSWRKR